MRNASTQSLLPPAGPRPRACRLALALALWLAAALAPTAPAGAVPNKEKIALSGAINDSEALAAAIYVPLAWALVVNRQSKSLSIFDLQTQALATDTTGSPLVIGSIDDPVAVATWDDTDAFTPLPTMARAFVAGFRSNLISVVDLLAAPSDPAAAVLTELDVSNAADGDTANPGPVALLVVNDTLYVAGGGDGTVQRYDILPNAPYLSHVSFGVGASDQTTASGNLVVCTVGDSLPLAGQQKPRVLHRFSSRNWVGCDGGSVAHFDDAGDVALRGDLSLAGAFARIGAVRALAGDPRSGTSILYVLDDGGDAIFALDVATGVFEGSTDPTLDPICNAGGVDRESIPVTSGAEATALISFTDPSVTGGGDFLAALVTSATTQELLLVDLQQIDKLVTTNPTCGLGATGSLVASVTLGLGDAFFPPGGSPAGLGQAIFHHIGYIGIPNFGVTDGVGALTLVSDDPVLTLQSTSESALAAVANRFDPTAPTALQTQLTWGSDETLQSSPAPTVLVRIEGQPTSVESIATASPLTGDTLQLTVQSSDLLTLSFLGPTSNERLEILVGASDADGDVGLSAAQVIFDTLAPTDPTGAGVVPGDSLLALAVSGVSDPDPGNGAVSGLGGFYVEFTGAKDQAGVPVAPLPANQFIPASGGGFSVTGLVNQVTYDFNLYAADGAGNVSSGSVAATGTPVPGEGIIALSGETGCTLSATGASGTGGGAALALLGALAMLALAWRRRRGR